MYDILITNARIADGTGNPMYHADLAVKDGKIVRICPRLRGEALRVIDGSGKVLAPGLIDAHSHLDGRIEEVNHCRHMLAQGVTTIIGGMYWKRANKYGAVAATVIGEALMVYGTFIHKMAPGGFSIGFVSMVLATVIYIVVCLATKPQKRVAVVVDSINEFFAK